MFIRIPFKPGAMICFWLKTVCTIKADQPYSKIKMEKMNAHLCYLKKNQTYVWLQVF